MAAQGFHVQTIPVNSPGRDPSSAHKTFWPLFIAATLPAANNFSRLHSTRGRGALQQRSLLPWLPKALIPASIPKTTAAHVNHAGNNTWEGVSMNF